MKTGRKKHLSRAPQSRGYLECLNRLQDPANASDSPTEGSVSLLLDSHTHTLFHGKNSRETANDTPGSGEVLRLQADRVRARRDRKVLGDLVFGLVSSQDPRRGSVIPERRLRRRERQLQQGPARSHLLQVSRLPAPFFHRLALLHLPPRLIVIVVLSFAVNWSPKKGSLARNDVSLWSRPEC